MTVKDKAIDLEELELLSVGEVARRLQCSESTIYRWINDGNMPAYKLGDQKIFVDKKELEEWIASRKIDALS